MTVKTVRFALLAVLALVVTPLWAGPVKAPAPRQIYGLVEQAYLPELGLILPAKIDTGAESASLSAVDIRRFRRDDEHWVRFRVPVAGMEMKEFELPLSRHVRIRRRASDYEKGEEKGYARRPVVEMRLCVGKREVTLDVNLADRRRFSQPMLIGSEGLKALGALVDVESALAMGAPGCEGAANAYRVPADGESR